MVASFRQTHVFPIAHVHGKGLVMDAILRPIEKGGSTVGGFLVIQSGIAPICYDIDLGLHVVSDVTAVAARKSDGASDKGTSE